MKLSRHLASDLLKKFSTEIFRNSNVVRKQHGNVQFWNLFPVNVDIRQ